VTLGEELLGVIYLDNTLAGLTPPEKSLTVLRVVSNQLAVSLDNAKAFEEIAHLKDRLEDETRFYRMEMEALPGDRDIIGKSASINTVLRQINKVAKNQCNRC
jgi:formate hydrogenlyase transcriptional activator